MVEFQEFFLNNGLRVFVNQDVDTSLVAFNLVYNVGARDEEAHKTGFAHLFEHLMFGGSINIPSFDTPLQNIGGENNAFTSNDLTNYYITLPKDNLETAFWLESDRMLSLSFSEKSLSVQRQVVIEEFNQRYLNQPYGDAFLRLRPLAYKHHPYQWATIGKNIDHIKEASMEDVKGFFNRFYKPNNAVLAISGDVTVEEIKILSEKWFGEIPAGKANVNDYPQEPKQTEARREEVVSNVPLDAIYIAFHMENKLHRDYYVADLLSDILASGNSSRLFLKLVKELSFFADISCYITGDHDRGLFVISGKINPTINMKTAEAALWKELDLIKSTLVSKNELIRVKNKMMTSVEFAKATALNKAMALAISALLGNPNLINEEPELYRSIREADIQRVANSILTNENSSTLIYKKQLS